ncbi:MAG: nuclear transport factor 2 family protein [Myxococcota bacterium]
MSAKEVGEKLVALCKEGKNLEAINTLYAEDIESVEAATPPGRERVAKGIDAIRGKNQWWLENHEVHSASVEGPFPHGDDRFAVIFNHDVTFKGDGSRRKMHEVGVFTLKDGKVAKEEFYYNMG